MSDKYKNFKELEENEKGNFEIECIDKGNQVTIIAPHGKKIEFKTTYIAKKITENLFNYYSLIGKRRSKNYEYLHITSHHFDEPKALDLVGKSAIVVAIHGCKDIQNEKNYGKNIFIGGRDKNLIKKFKKVFIDAQLPFSTDVFPGEEFNNICNRGSTEKGVQFELTESFRKDKVKSENFIMIVRACLEKSEEKLS